VQAAVTATLSGVDPQVENEDGDTVIAIMPGSLEEAFRVTGETDGLHVKEAGRLPEPTCGENLIFKLLGFQLTVEELSDADAK